MPHNINLLITNQKESALTLSFFSRHKHLPL
nr:MAG TPA: hypothetical protein [Caudoviricetes sp.]